MHKTSVRFSNQDYERIKAQSEIESISVADMVRKLVGSALEAQRNGREAQDAQGEDNGTTTEALRDQLREKDQQISELHQLFAMKEKNLATFGEQLERAQLQLEDMRAKEKRSWWQRTFGKRQK